MLLRMRLEEIPDHIGGVELVAFLADDARGQPIDAARPHMTHVVDEIFHHLRAVAAVIEDDLLDALGASGQRSRSRHCRRFCSMGGCWISSPRSRSTPPAGNSSGSPRPIM